jgi:general secretion pathway protein B
MSFILDALKKSEQERRRREVPDLHTEHAPILARRPRIPWSLVIGLALLLNAGLLLWWLRPWQPPVAAVDATPAAAVVAEEPAPAAAPTVPLPVVEPEMTLQETPPLPPAVPVVPARPEPAPGREMVATTLAASPPPDVNDLPRSIRAELPAIEITLHFFTDAPNSRMVRINGRNLREGQQVNPNLTLQEITPEGVVLDFRGQLFSAGR